MFVRVDIENELNCSCVVVAYCSGSLNCGVTDWGSDGVIDTWRSFFNNFLMSSLNGTISFIKMDIIAKLVSKNLNFDVSGSGDILFNKDSVITEGFEWFTFTTFQGLKELIFIANYSHSFSSTSRDSLNQNRVFHFVCFFEEVFRGLILSVITGDHWYIGVGHDLFGLTFAAHGCYSGGRRSDELDSML